MESEVEKVDVKVADGKKQFDKTMDKILFVVVALGLFSSAILDSPFPIVAMVMSIVACALGQAADRSFFYDYALEQYRFSKRNIILAAQQEILNNLSFLEERTLKDWGARIEAKVYFLHQAQPGYFTIKLYDDGQYGEYSLGDLGSYLDWRNHQGSKADLGSSTPEGLICPEDTQGETRKNNVTETPTETQDQTSEHHGESGHL